MEIAMIYSELRLLPALWKVLQLLQNKSFGKSAKGFFAAILLQQEWENKKWIEEETEMECLYLCFTGTEGF